MKKQIRVNRWFQRVAFLGLVMVGIQSCGSSDGSPDSVSSMSGQNMSITGPLDAPALRSALITGASSVDEKELWLCTNSDNHHVLAYDFYADGSGTERDSANPIPDLVSTFTWQTTSATSLTTTLVSTTSSLSMTPTLASGEEKSFTNIQFADNNNMSFLLLESPTNSCYRLPPKPETPAVPVDSNLLTYDGVNYPLTYGFEVLIQFSPIEFGDTHLSANFHTADAQIQPVVILDHLTLFWVTPLDATVSFNATLLSPGGDGFESATFNFAPNSLPQNDPSLADQFIFQHGSVKIDVNQDGLINNDENLKESFNVIGGTITVERFGEFLNRMSFNLTLENGLPVEGSFEGDFPAFGQL